MIDRQHGRFVFECDYCDETLDTDETDWAEALAVFKRERWRSIGQGGEWLHSCSTCNRRADKDTF